VSGLRQVLFLMDTLTVLSLKLVAIYRWQDPVTYYSYDGSFTIDISLLNIKIIKWYNNDNCENYRRNKLHKNKRRLRTRYYHSTWNC